jgi:hypothetical protein
MRAFVNSLSRNKQDDVFRIGYVSDCHYDPTVASPSWALGRANTLTYLANFVSAMEEYRPHLIIHGGDKTGASSSNQTTQQSWYQSALDAVAASRFPVKDGVAPGNHDVEYMSFAQLLAKHSGETWMETGVMYGYWESGGLGFISLDAQYDTNDDTHLSAEHVGYGHLDATQLSWLATKLSTVDKPVIVNVHQLAGEFDTDFDLYDLAQSVYHIDNREDLRDILEASGKVICVLHGHVHQAKAMVINGIPYISCPSTSPGGTNVVDLPGTGKGEWLTVEINKTRQTVTYASRTNLDGVHATVYQQTIPWGAFAKPAPTRVINPSEFTYVEDKKLAVKGWPVNRYTGDPRLTDTGMKIQGVGSNGQEIWTHAAQSGTFTYSFSMRLADNAIRAIRTSANSNAVHIVLEADGDISAYDGVSLTVVGSYSVDTWYAVEIVVNTATDTYTLKVDGVALATDFDMRAAVTSITALMIETNVGVMYLDSLKVEAS